MDIVKAVKVVEDMLQKQMLLRDVSEQYGEPVMARDYGRQAEALRTLLEEVKKK